MRFKPSTIIPSDFEYLDSYDMGGNDIGDIPFNISECGRLMDVSPVENFTDLGKCCVCGTVHRYGEVWTHMPTDLRICIGHICANKYGLYAADAEYAALRGAHIRKIERIKERRRVRSEMRAHLTLNPGLAQALRGSHHILKDLRAKMIRWGNLSEKQVALALKLEQQVIEDALADGPDKNVPVIDGRTTVTAEIVGIKWVPGFGYSAVEVCKMVCKVRAEDGTYTLYGTMPEALQSAIMELRDVNTTDGEYEDLKAIIRRIKPTVRFDCRIKVSENDPSFGIINRPTKAEVLA